MDNRERERSGIYEPHVRAIEETVRKYNVFLFVRPTEKESTALIELGFFTKSMDIHDKSSNWGPMAGMVPCDPYFSKKMQAAAPNPKIHPHPHGRAKPFHLQLNQETLNMLVRNVKIKKSQRLWIVRKPNLVRVAPGGSEAIGVGDESGPMRLWDGAGPRATETFLIDRQLKVFYVNWSHPGRVSGTLEPLWVWAYDFAGVKPVTGDYDLWMVVPHLASWASHMGSELTKDEHGESAASQFTKSLMEEMNKACKTIAPRTQKVFNHGAEAQNYAFTQALDDKGLVMFTAAGASRMVEIFDMPRIMADLELMGYLPIYNKRYSELDARLMGRSTIKQVARVETLKKELSAIYEGKDSHGNDQAVKFSQELFDSRPGASKPLLHQFRQKRAELIAARGDVFAGIARRAADRAAFRRAVDELRALRNSPRAVEPPGAGAAAGQDTPALRRRLVAHGGWKVLRTAVHQGYESARITRFYDEIRRAVESMGNEPLCLRQDDFPAGLRRLTALSRKILRKMQEDAVNAATGGGESDPEKILEWTQNNDVILEQFKQACDELERVQRIPVAP